MKHKVFLLPHNGRDIQTLKRFFDKRSPVEENEFEYPNETPIPLSGSFNVVIFELSGRDYVESLDIHFADLVRRFDKDGNKNYFFFIASNIKPLSFNPTANTRMFKPNFNEIVKWPTFDSLDYLLSNVRADVFRLRLEKLCLMTCLVMILFEKIYKNFDDVSLDELDRGLRDIFVDWSQNCNGTSDIIKKINHFFINNNFFGSGIVLPSVKYEPDPQAI